MAAPAPERVAGRSDSFPPYGVVPHSSLGICATPPVDREELPDAPPRRHGWWGIGHSSGWQTACRRCGRAVSACVAAGQPDGRREDGGRDPDGPREPYRAGDVGGPPGAAVAEGRPGLHPAAVDVATAQPPAP